MKKSRFLIILVLIAAGGALFLIGVPEEISDPERLAAVVDRAGAWGPILFILLAMAAFPLLLLGPPVWASVALWPWPLAFLYSYIACVASSVAVYGLARWRGYEWAQRRVSERLRRHEDRLESRPFLAVMALRLGLWGNPLVDLLIGVTKVPLRSYLVATLLGQIPATGVQIALGLGGLSIIRTVPTWVWVTAVAAGVGLVLAIRRRRRRLSQAPTA